MVLHAGGAREARSAEGGRCGRGSPPPGGVWGDAQEKFEKMHVNVAICGTLVRQ